MKRIKTDMHNNKSQLAAIESYFQAYLLNKDPLSIQTFVNSDADLNSSHRLKIYYDAYRLRLIEILQEDYPKLNHLMGNEDFELLCKDYIEAYPSPYFSVRYFGQFLSQFLLENDALPYLSEMAEFEWKLNDTFDAANSPIIESHVLYALPAEHWGDLRLQFHHSLQQMDCHWNVPKIWQAIDVNEAIPEPQQEAEAITWILWRKELGSFYRSLTPLEVLCLNHFQDGHNFAEVCEALCQKIPEEAVPKEALSFIQRSIADCIIADIL